jgi:hypothetical protein
VGRKLMPGEMKFLCPNGKTPILERPVHAGLISPRGKTPLLLTSLKKLAQGLLYESTRFIKPLHNINHPSRMITTRLPIRIISMIPPSEP